MRRRLMWIVPGLAAVAITGFLLAKGPIDPVILPAPTAPAFTLTIPALAKQVGEKPETPELPITQVVLYSNGVGYFQRDGQVQGNAHVDLSFPVQDVNDLLKSMVLQDLGGGQVSAVSYDSRDPLDKTLNSFAIRLANNPTHGMILYQARGEKVEVQLDAKAGVRSHPDVLQGTIVGVEMKAAASKETAPVEMLNLWCMEGMRTIPLAEVVCVRFLNPAIDSEVRRALEVLASSHDNQKKSVRLQFSGTGKRDVRLGYIVESPLWRTSYRLLVDKQGKVFVQGWALVENPSSDDWKDVRMSLVSARPISFKMDLYQPLYAPRPLVQNQLQPAMRPTAYTASINGAGNQLDSGATTGLPFAPISSASSSTMGTTIVPSGGTYITGFTNSAATTGVQTPAPIVTPQESQISLQNGVVTHTKADDLGNSFQYAIDQPVTIPRQKSALLPIVNSGLDAERVSVYTPNLNMKYPLMALRLKNSTGVHLMQGPVTVFEGNGYAGDAQLPDLKPGEQRLVSYAVDLGTEVEAKSESSKEHLAKIRLHEGKLTSTGLARESMKYSITNRGPNDRVVVVEHMPSDADCRNVGKEKPYEQTPTVRRFEKKVAAGKTVCLEVTEEKEMKSDNAILSLNQEAVAWFLKCEFSDAKVKAAFEKLQEFQANSAATDKENARLQQQMDGIKADQERLRANLKEMPATSNAHKRYLEKFDTQETAIEKLQTQIQALEALAQKQQQETEAFVATLEMQTTIRKEAGPASPRK